MAGGRPTSFSKEMKEEIFQEYEDYFRKNQKVPPKSDKIWTAIKESSRLPKTVTEGAIYTAMLVKFNQLMSPEKKDQSIESNQSNTSTKSLNNSKLDNSNENEIEFKIKISNQVWDKIKPVEIMYKRVGGEGKSRRKDDRKYKVLPNGVWTYSLSRAIARQKKDVPCRWCYKRSKVFTSEYAEKYLTVHGYCNTCQSELNGYILNEPNLDAVFVDFHIKITKIDYLKHDQKKIQPNVKIDSSTAQSIYGSKESYGQAAVIQRKMLRQSVDEMFEAPVERVPTKNAIRCAQYRQRKLQQIDTCPIKSLEMLKLTFHNDWIQMIGSNPFYVSYVNTDTRVLYNVFKKKKKQTTIFCDATGGIARKIVRENGEHSKRIFLYAFVIADDFEIPVYSMLSEVHTMSHITNWFNEYIRLYNDIPNEFVCDMSTVLLNAAAKSFAGCANINDYVEWLFNLVKHSNNNGRNIKCYIRIDIAHFIKNITTSECLKGKPPDQKQFYIRATCLMIKCTCLPQAQQILNSILIVAKSSNKGEAFSTHKQYIDNLISNDVSEDYISNISNDYQSEVGSIMNEENGIQSNSMKDWLTSINRSSTGEALENDNDNENNDLENSQIVKFLLRLCESLVLWTGVAAKHFNTTVTASSAHVENYFKQMKKYLEKCIPGRVDEIVAAHIDIIDGIIIEASQKFIDFIDAAGGVPNLLQDCPQLLNDYQTLHTCKTVSNRDDSNDTEVNDMESNRDDSNAIEVNNTESNKKDSSTSNINVSCIACKRGDIPGGAHRCVKCSKAVHPFEGCSQSCGDEEGYGEKRICVACNADSGVFATHKQSQAACSVSNDESNSISKQLNEKERWQRRGKPSHSYLAPVKNWNIDKKVQGKPKIAMLTNASLSTTVHTVAKKKVVLRNTCASDSILQLFAAMYAHFPHCHGYMDEIHCVVRAYEIAILLAKW